MNTPDDVTGPINIGNPREFTVLELANKVIELTGSRSKLIFKPLPADDPRQRQPDITLAKKLLGWAPQIELKEGLENTVRYFRAQLFDAAAQPDVIPIARMCEGAHVAQQRQQPLERRAVT
jgi:UDP-glucuronate decarboxylase